MVRWLRWHCPPDTGFEIRTLAVWGRARYLSVTEAPHNTNFHTWMGKKHFVFFKPPRPGTEPRTLAWKAAVLTTTLGPPPISLTIRTRKSCLPLPQVSHFKFDKDQPTLSRVSLITLDSLSHKDSEIMSKIETKWLPFWILYLEIWKRRTFLFHIDYDLAIMQFFYDYK